MDLFLVGVLLVFNLLASYWNAYAAGSVWRTSKLVGGYQRFMAWAVVSMSAAGFTMCFAIIGGFVAYKLHYLDVRTTELLFNISYVVVVPVILASGWAITFDSWKQRVQSGRGTGIALFNTGASTYNTISFFDSITETVKDIIGDFDENPYAWLAIVLFAFALIGGTMTTTLLVRHYAKNDVFAPAEPEHEVEDTSPDFPGYGYRGPRRYYEH